MADENQDQQQVEHQEQSDRQGEPKGNFRQALDAERARGEQLQRENAMLRAGVDLDSAAGQLFAKGYDGPLESDEIRKIASQVNALRDAATVTPSEPDPSVAYRETVERGTNHPGTTPGGTTPTRQPLPVEKIEELAYKDAKASGRDLDGVRQQLFAAHLGAARIKGENVWDPRAHRLKAAQFDAASQTYGSAAEVPVD